MSEPTLGDLSCTPTKPVPNLPLLRKTVDWARVEAEKDDDESEWYQRTWRFARDSSASCGTAFCIAGKIIEDDPDVEWVRVGFQAYVVRMPDGRVKHPFEYARDRLGLLPFEADVLFHPDNTIDVVEEIATQIAARGGERL